MLEIPQQVLIGPYKYKVIIRDKDWYDDTEAYGNSWVDKKVINVSTVGDASSQLNTFIHECLHAHWAFFHMEKKVKEEEAVSKMSTAFLTLIRQNPQVLVLIAKVMNGDYDES